MTVRRPWWVVGAWVLLVLFGLFTTQRLGHRWFQSFSIPGYSAYEANQRTLKTFGSGEQVPLVVVLSTPNRDVTRVPGIQKAIDAAAAKVKGDRVGSWFDTRSDMYLSKDRHTMVATIRLYPSVTTSALGTL